MIKKIPQNTTKPHKTERGTRAAGIEMNGQRDKSAHLEAQDPAVNKSPLFRYPIQTT
jgi:hypothetical protein